MASTIDPGTTFAHYRILGPLGAGGMGEVYKAYDTSLERTIAIKILPPQLVKNEERLRRFIQEARAASSLSHPHIITIHEIGEADIGSDDERQSVHYIAMELVEGVTLRRKIHDERTDVRVTLGYLAQAADGIAKAHAAGIIHRDLKPENIMVSADGFAKVLDFGLAKLTAPREAASGGTDTTAVWNETRQGVVMGTVAYMSPEQAQGKPVDHRSDIFSFGSILYEAATLRRPFQADSDIDLMHRILHDKPVPVDELNPAIPAELRRVIRRCLAKDPERRYQSMKDLAIELREIVEEFDDLSASASSGSTTGGAPIAAPSSRGTRFAFVAALVVGAVSLASAALLWHRAQTVPSESAPFGSVNIQRLTSTGLAEKSTISPDGRYVAFVNATRDGRQGITVRQVATSSTVEVLAPGERISGIAFSPDSSYIYFSRAESIGGGPRYSWLYQIPSLGGTPRQVVYDVDTSVSFSPDGNRIAFGRGRPTTRENVYVIANIDGTGEHVAATLPSFLPPSPPRWSPDGRHLAIAYRLPPVGADAAPALIDVQSGELTVIGDREWWDMADTIWLPGGEELLVAGSRAGQTRNQIWRQKVSGAKPVRITNDFNSYQELSLTADGTTLAADYFLREGKLRIGRAEDSSGGDVVTTAEGLQLEWIDASSTRKIVGQSVSDSGTDIVLIDADTGTLKPLTSDGASLMPTISADGELIAFIDSELGLQLMTAEGSLRRRITPASARALFPRIAPDGSAVVYDFDAGLWRVSSNGGTPVRIADRGLFDEAEISPDSTRLAVQYYKETPEGPVGTLRVISMTDGATAGEIPFRPSVNLAWVPGEEAIGYVRFEAGVDNIHIQPLDGSPSRQLTRFTEEQIFSYAFLPDGMLATVRGRQPSDVMLIRDMSGSEQR